MSTPNGQGRIRQWLHRRSARQALGAVLFTLGAGFTIGIAVAGNSEHPPSAGIQGFLALTAILSQGGAAWAFSAEGRADPGLATSAIGRLYRKGQQAGTARELVEHLYEHQPPVAEVRKHLGPLSVTLSSLEEGYVDAINDWRTFKPHIVEDIEDGNGDEEI